jgi:heme/copper-type cytochrome/quinol oxidase subunit 2
MRIKTLIIGGIIALAAPFALLASTSNVSASPVSQIQDGVSAVDDSGTTADALPDNIKTIINLMLYIVGIASVIMLVFGGIRYTTSAGNDSNLTKAKQTITYSIVGLVVAILAFAIVNFVIGNVGDESSKPAPGDVTSPSVTECAKYGYDYDIVTNKCKAKP